MDYTIINNETGEVIEAHLNIDEKTFRILVLRYKELFGPGGGVGEDTPYDLKGYITTTNTDDIDADYMNSRFKKYLKVLQSNNVNEIEQAKKLASMSKISRILENIRKVIADDRKQKQPLVLRINEAFIFNVARKAIQEKNSTFIMPKSPISLF